MDVENEIKEDLNSHGGGKLSDLKDTKKELNSTCDQALNLINISRNMLLAKLSDKQKIKSKQYEYLNYINYKINEITNYDKKNRHLLENSSKIANQKKLLKNGKNIFII